MSNDLDDAVLSQEDMFWKYQPWYYVQYFIRRFSATIFITPFVVWVYGSRMFAAYLCLLILALLYDFIASPYAYDLRVKKPDFVKRVIEKKELLFVGTREERWMTAKFISWLYMALFVIIFEEVAFGGLGEGGILSVTLLSTMNALFVLMFFSFFGPASLSRKRTGFLLSGHDRGLEFLFYWGQSRIIYALNFTLSAAFYLASFTMVYVFMFLFTMSGEELPLSRLIQFGIPVFGALFCSFVLIASNTVCILFKAAFVDVSRSIEEKQK